MAQLEHLEDLHSHPACQDVKSLQEIIAEARPQNKHQYRILEETEAHLINDGIAPSLSAYLIHEHQFKDKGTREIAKNLGACAPNILKLMRRMGIPIRTPSEAAERRRKRPSKEELESMYHKQGASGIEIATRFEVDPTSVYNWMESYGLERRNPAQARTRNTCFPSREELESMYHKQGRTLSQISREFNVSQSTVTRWMQKHNIKTRNNSEIARRKSKNPGKNVLRRMYHEKQMSTYDISKAFGVDPSTAYDWMVQHQLIRRSISDSMIGRQLSEEHKKKIGENSKRRWKNPAYRKKVIDAISGENHPNFNGWSSLEPYSPEFIKIMRDYIRARDHYACQSCGKTEDEEGKSLSVHHIDYNKGNNDEKNLVALCNGCHVPTNVVNGDRKVWTDLFQEQIENIYKNMNGKEYEHLLRLEAELRKKTGLEYQVKTEAA